MANSTYYHSMARCDHASGSLRASSLARQLTGVGPSEDYRQTQILPTGAWVGRASAIACSELLAAAARSRRRSRRRWLHCSRCSARQRRLASRVRLGSAAYRSRRLRAHALAIASPPGGHVGALLEPLDFRRLIHRQQRVSLPERLRELFLGDARQPLPRRAASAASIHTLNEGGKRLADQAGGAAKCTVAATIARGDGRGSEVRGRHVRESSEKLVRTAVRTGFFERRCGRSKALFF